MTQENFLVSGNGVFFFFLFFWVYFSLSQHPGWGSGWCKKNLNLRPLKRQTELGNEDVARCNPSPGRATKLTPFNIWLVLAGNSSGKFMLSYVSGGKVFL